MDVLDGVEDERDASLKHRREGREHEAAESEDGTQQGRVCYEAVHVCDRGDNGSDNDITHNLLDAAWFMNA